MNEAKRNEIAERTGGVARTPEISQWASAIDAFFMTGEEQYFSIVDEKQLEAFTALVGHDQITAAQILFWEYEATAAELRAESGEHYEFEGTTTIVELQEVLGDLGVMLEFPDCFRTRLTIALDEQVAIMYDYTSSTEPVVCEECANSEDPELREVLDGNPFYSCDHCSDEHTYSYAAYLVPRGQGAQDFIL